MARKRRMKPEQKYGRVYYGADGLPLAFHPLNGVSHRLRCMDDVEREYQAGRLSPEDLERSQKAWAAYQERHGYVG